MENQKYGSQGRKNFFPNHKKNKMKNIMKILVKLFGGMKNIY